MSKHFEIVREFEVDASPSQVWDAITTGTGGWLWPMEYEPKEGGAAPFGGTVVAWDPPHRLTGRTEDAEGISVQTFNQVDHLMEPREGGGSWVRYVHSGILVEDWDNQYDGANKHTDFYMHTLREYLRYFTGRIAVFGGAEGPKASGAPDAFETAARALGLADDAAEGATVQVELPGAGRVEAVLDFRNPYFIGLRTDQAMYRFFGRNHFGATVGVSVHDFAPGADAERIGADWTRWLAGVYA
ncbi:SRPBCC domain-containing protein [Streptomyces sp. NPDC087422]|uniref:SRPBCC family protein n=1 Tax=Streptomyces sp. NPDC087422 TaxID=3365786 RepID=UPI0037F98C52